MSYLLDTCVCVELLHANTTIANRLAAVGLPQCSISEITYAELLYGIEHNKRGWSKEKQLAQRNAVEEMCRSLNLLPISEAIPEFARQKALLAHKGQLIEDADIYIGCTAKVHGLILVTDNVKHLSRIDGLSIENWID